MNRVAEILTYPVGSLAGIMAWLAFRRLADTGLLADVIVFGVGVAILSAATTAAVVGWLLERALNRDHAAAMEAVADARRVVEEAREERRRDVARYRSR